MSERSLGYVQSPKNSNGITRSKTTLQLRLWRFQRSLTALDKINAREWGRLQFPSLYMLLDKNKVYIGEAKDVYARLKTHLSTTDPKIRNWRDVVVINDGRPATQSDLNDIVVRREIEWYLNRLFGLNRYTVVSQGSRQQLTGLQKTYVDNLKQELDFLLEKEGLVTKFFARVREQEVDLEEVKKLLAKNGRDIEQWSAYKAKIDGQQVFIRPGSEKKKGWQITFRDVFKDALQSGDGALLVPRGRVLLIPFAEVQKVVGDRSRYRQNTIDIYVRFTEEGATVSYGSNTVDVSRYFLIQE